MATVEQATVIGESLSLLPDDVGPEVRDKAEQALLDHAGRLEPTLLHRLGQRILDHVAPDVAEAALEARLAADERRALARRHFTLSPGRDGCTRLSGWLDTEAAAVVGAAIDPLSKPIPGMAGDPDLHTPGQRRADALTEVCRLALASGELPDCGGERPHITVTTRLDVLSGLLDEVGVFHAGRHAGRLGPGEVSAGEVSAGRVNTGRINTGRISTGRISTGRVNTGLVNSGRVNTGLVNSGNVAGQVAAGRANTGRAGSGRIGRLPSGASHDDADRGARGARLGPGLLDTGGLLPAGTVRRLACDAELIPAVLGTDGAVLDVGRSKRLFVGSARRALVLRDGGCAFPAATDRPAGATPTT